MLQLKQQISRLSDKERLEVSAFLHRLKQDSPAWQKEMARRMAEIFAAREAALPPGYFFYLADLVRRTLSPLSGREAYETGAGVFDHPAKAMELLETRLLDPFVVEREALALVQAMFLRYQQSRAARAPARSAQKAVFSSAHAVGGKMAAQPRLIVPSPN